MTDHPDPAWVAVGRACYALAVDAGLAKDDRHEAFNFAMHLNWHPVGVTPAAPAAEERPAKYLNVDAANPDPNQISVLNPYGGAPPRP
jgi:hypothetical protein